MPRPLQKLQRFFRELKRRNVYKVAATYAVVGFVLIQAADLIFPALNIPSWAYSLVVVLILFGFPVAIVLAWAFEMTPKGVRRTAEAEPVEGESEVATGGPRTAYKLLLGLGLVAGAVAGGWYLTGGGGDTISDRTVAVLPFETLGDTASSPITEGLHNDLLTRLHGVSELTVIARPSVMRYRNTAKPISQVAEELKARWLVTAAVQSAGDQIQVNVQLIDPRTEAQRWADSYRRELTAENLFALQDEITQQIAGELQTQLTPGEQGRVETRPTGSLDSYKLAVRARSLLDQRTGPEMRRAARLFERAIERDSTYALAWVGLSDALALLADYGHANRDTVLPEARRAARRALDLEPQSAEAHASLAMVHYGYGEGPEAVGQLRRALELRPNYAEAHNWLSWLYLLLGEPGRALESAKRAVDLDPVSPEPMWNLALSHMVLDRPDSVLAVTKEDRDLGREYATSFLFEATAMHRLDRLEDARSRLRGIRVTWAPSAPLAALAVIDVATGDSSSAREKLSRLEEEAETPFYAGLIHAALGDHAEAFDTFERVDGWATSPHLVWPTLSLRYLYPEVLGPLRSDPRYRKLIRTINVAWGLNPGGTLPDSVDVSLGSENED